MIVIDVEASGLAVESYPIEIAWQDSEDLGNFDTFLIVPDQRWTHWDEYAEEEIHHITREMLSEEGVSIDEACNRLNQKLIGTTVYSDALEYDYAWIMTLFETANKTPSFEMASIFDLLPDLTETKYETYVNDEVVIHRALGDARQIISLYRQVVKNK
tara:strand:+ start:206 stop:679 length:474 start_codon:yes stop_codon:yes gene_type:complete